MNRLKNIDKRWLILVVVIGIVVALVPPVRNRLTLQYELLRARIIFYFNPPSEAVFEPSGETEPLTVETAIGTARAEMLLTLTPEVTMTPQATKIDPTAKPTITPIPLPEQVDLEGDRVYTDQKNRWNYCGPANLTMALKFWGWKGLPGETADLRDQIASVVKPGFVDPTKSLIDRGRLDLNVMPYEMADFVNEYTGYSALIRHGGEPYVLKALLAAGFPIIAEKGYYEHDTSGKISWMGHYLFITGYDDVEQVFIVQDAYYLNGEKPRKNIHIKYEDFLEGWRAFNYLFMVVYPTEQETLAMQTLGNWADPNWANQHAQQLAEKDTSTQQGINLFFSWFNQGTSAVQQADYPTAAAAYDRAFAIYASLPQDNNQRPYRMVWYQTGPYWAYFYTGRYQDVINLADVTLSTPSTGPTLEESLYWRGMAEYALGNTVAALTDMRETLRLNPNFAPGIQRLQEWGATP